MARIPLIGGTYQARSIIANAQRAINYYPEINPKDAPVPVTHYQRPGLIRKAEGPAGTVRALYRASNGNGYCVIGQGVYSISAAWALTQIGTLDTILTTPVSMIDNGTTMLIADGSTLGYQVVLATNAFSTIADSTFTGAVRADYIDTFLVWNTPNTQFFGSTLSASTSAGAITFDPTYFASKVGYPDNLQTLIVNKNELLLFGALKSEIWFDAGNTNFPFAKLPGAYIEHGIAAPYSVASADISVFWLAQDLQGIGMVLRQRGYETKTISTPPIARAIQRMAAAGTIADAIGFTFQVENHIFYVLTFPTGNETWVWDEASDLWHQWAWTDANGALNRHRANCFAFINGTLTCGDWENGRLYALDTETYTDDGGPISFVRGFPHISSATGPRGTPIDTGGSRMQFKSFIADIECGLAPKDALGNPAEITLRWSLDRGRTYGQGVLMPAGSPGEYLTWPTWRQAGISRDMVFEISHSIAGPAALNGAWVDADLLAS